MLRAVAQRPSGQPRNHPQSVAAPTDVGLPFSVVACGRGGCRREAVLSYHRSSMSTCRLIISETNAVNTARHDYLLSTATVCTSSRKALRTACVSFFLLAQLKHDRQRLRLRTAVPLVAPRLNIPELPAQKQLGDCLQVLATGTSTVSRFLNEIGFELGSSLISSILQPVVPVLALCSSGSSSELFHSLQRRVWKAKGSSRPYPVCNARFIFGGSCMTITQRPCVCVVEGQS